jgi:predicted acetyltransferase
MSEIRQLSEADYDAFIAIAANAYPSFNIASEEDRQRMKQRFITRSQEPTNHFYGLYREGKLLGGMILYDFTMKLLSTMAQAGGVGLVAVDLLHKKEKVASELISYFLRHYKDRGAAMALLYPFRPDFYKKMGFGYGTKMNQYRVRPADFPKGPTKEHIAYLREEDKELLRDCYNRYLQKTNGLIEKSALELKSMFTNPELRIVGCKEGGSVSGYMTFTFKQSGNASSFVNDIHVREFVYENRAALSELLTFLHTQSDQINRVVFNTQDEYFHYLLSDPRNGSDNLLPHVYHESNTQGVGIMYRVIDTAGIFKVLGDHNFGGQSCRLKLSIGDTFFQENAGSTVIHFESGRPRPGAGQDYDVEVRLDVSDFSSLLMGAVDFSSLYAYGRADISDPQYVDTVQRLFSTQQKPLCTTPF